MLRRPGTLAALVVWLHTAACVGVTAGPVELPVPVLVGPLERIGDQAPRRDQRDGVAPIDARVEFLRSGGGHSRPEEGDGGSGTRAAGPHERRDDVGSRIGDAWRTAGSRPGDVIYLDALQARAWAHSYILFALGGVETTVQGEVTRPKEAQP